jgi:hypothetical protein
MIKAGRVSQQKAPDISAFALLSTSPTSRNTAEAAVRR